MAGSAQKMSREAKHESAPMKRRGHSPPPRLARRIPNHICEDGIARARAPVVADTAYLSPTRYPTRAGVVAPCNMDHPTSNRAPRHAHSGRPPLPTGGWKGRLIYSARARARGEGATAQHTSSQAHICHLWALCRMGHPASAAQRRLAGRDACCTHRTSRSDQLASRRASRRPTTRCATTRGAAAGAHTATRRDAGIPGGALVAAAQK
jgi:hypothetical protein